MYYFSQGKTTFFLFIYLSIYISIYLSIYLYLYLSINLSINLSSRGKLVARERINLLLDPGSPFLELSQETLTNLIDP